MKVVILCGGFGTRLHSETEYKPKPMVTVGTKPILWHIMKHYAHYGFKEFVLALGYRGNVIRDYFVNYYCYNNDFTVQLGNMEKILVHNNHGEEDWKVTLVETGEKSMTGYRLKIAGKYIQEDDFMLTYGDAVSDVNISKLIQFHKENNTVGTVTGVFPPSRFGDLIVDGSKVKHFKQKQRDLKFLNPINGGYFVFKREFLDLIPNDPDADLEGIAMQDITRRKELSVFRHEGFWQNMDTYREYKLLNKMWIENPKWKIWE